MTKYDLPIVYLDNWHMKTDILNDVNKYALKERNALSLGRIVKMELKSYL